MPSSAHRNILQSEDVLLLLIIRGHGSLRPVQVQRRLSLEGLLGRGLCDLLVFVERQLGSPQHDIDLVPRPLRRLDGGVLPFVLAHQGAFEGVIVSRTAAL